jgi:hypothetical protein
VSRWAHLLIYLQYCSWRRTHGCTCTRSLEAHTDQCKNQFKNMIAPEKNHSKIQLIAVSLELSARYIVRFNRSDAVTEQQSKSYTYLVWWIHPTFLGRSL